MSRIKTFLHNNGFYFALLACILVAAMTSVWAIRTMLKGMAQKDNQILTGEGNTTWQAEETKPVQPAAGEAKDVPISGASGASSAASSGQGQVSEPSALQTEQEASAEPSAAAATSSPWPVDGKVSKPFSGNELVYNATLKDWRTHNGTDLAAESGSAVRCAIAGKVSAVYEDALFGTVVEVQSDSGRVWRYCGLAKNPAAKVDAVLAPGDAIGTVGVMPAEAKDGAHLHLEVLEGGNYTDPEPQLP